MDKVDVLKKALYLAKKGFHKEALKYFELDTSPVLPPVVMSYYAHSLAVVEKDYDRAVVICTTAAKREFYNPEIYRNLGRILFLRGHKRRAYKAYKKGLKIDETHKGLLSEIKAMGMRRRPPIAFLGRGHPLNRFLGKLTGQLPARGRSARQQAKLNKKRND